MSAPTDKMMEIVVFGGYISGHDVDKWEGQQLIAKEGRVVAHPKVEPIYPRMKELQTFLGTPRVQLNTLEQNQKYYKDGIQILDEIVLKRKSSL